jgi:hypothetical protein
MEEGTELCMHMLSLTRSREIVSEDLGLDWWIILKWM